MVDGHIDPIFFAIPFFFLAIWCEIRAVKKLRAQGKRIIGFERRDSRASLWTGTISLLFVGAINLLGVVIAQWLWEHRIADPGTGAWALAGVIIGWDFVYYWHHRWEHEIRILWACHVSHHSSERYNLTTALRQPWTPLFGVLLYPWLAFVGFEVWMIAVAASINLVYQFWVHTETIDRMPKWFEFLLNTPSHHRVHHGSNPEYLDKNYAGILMIWDRLFGSFEPERAPVQYGLTKNINTFNLVRINFHEYQDIIRDVRHSTTWRDRFRAIFGPPGFTATRTGASAITPS